MAWNSDLHPSDMGVFLLKNRVGCSSTDSHKCYEINNPSNAIRTQFHLTSKGHTASRLTGLHLSMYCVMCAEAGAFHWMGWELGWLPDSDIITWTGR